MTQRTRRARAALAIVAAAFMPARCFTPMAIARSLSEEAVQTMLEVAWEQSVDQLEQRVGGGEAQAPGDESGVRPDAVARGLSRN